MIISQTGYGRIFAGDTQMEYDCQITQTGDAELMVSEGIFTAPNGSQYQIPEQSFSLTDGTWRIELGSFTGQPIGVTPILVEMFPPDNWRLVQILAGYGAGIQVESGSIVSDVYVLEVLPGFPPT